MTNGGEVALAAPTLALDAPRTLSRGVGMWRVLALVLFAAVIVAAVWWAPVELMAIPAVGLLHAAMGALISAITALLMFDYARTTGRRGFLAIGVTYLMLAVLLGVFPLTFPDVMLDDRALVGSFQTPVGLFFGWHFAVPVGLSVAAVLLYVDERRHRRPGLTPGQVRISALAGFTGAAFIALMALLWSSLGLPDLLVAPGRLTGFSVWLKVLALALSLVFVGVALYTARSGSLIHGWLAATALLGLGEAVISYASMQRYTFGWYTSRLLWLVAVSLLLFALIRSLFRVAEANAELGTVDALTGAASRTAFLQTLTREIGRAELEGEQVALLVVNLDRFKEINEQLGQESGDEVLRRVAHRIGKRVGDGDLLGRLAGDQFGVIATGQPDQESALAIAESLLEDVRRPIELSEATVRVTAATGIALSGRDAGTTDELMQCADLALAVAKRGAGDRSVCFDPAFGAQALARLRIRREIADGLKSREFCLFYQPIIDMADGRMAGVEALARWHRVGEVRPAGQWIPVAESTGQIIDVAHQLLDCVVVDLPQWVADRGDTFFVTLNVSPLELGERRYVDALIEGLASHARNIVIEVTESLELQERSEACAHLQRMRDAGLRLAIDDFGTGYSNLSLLERLRPALLKMDRSLISQAATDPQAGTALLKAACTLATSLGCEVVVEGVETPAEAAVAADVRARYAQGFLHGRPAPLEDWVRHDAVPHSERWEPQDAVLQYP